MKNLFLTLLFLVGAAAGGCALFLTPVMMFSDIAISRMWLNWLGLVAITGLAIRASFRLWPDGRRRLWLIWGGLLVAGIGGWVLFIMLAFRNFN